MKTLFRILLMGLGLPIAAQQLNQHGEQVTEKLRLVTFLTEKHRKITKIAIFALVGSMLIVTGLSMSILSTTLYFDLGQGNRLTFSFIASLVILATGLSFGGYALRKIRKLEKEFAYQQQYAQHTTSLGKTILHSILNSLVSDPLNLMGSKKSIN